MAIPQAYLSSSFLREPKKDHKILFLCGFTDYVYNRTTQIVLAFYLTPGMVDRPSKGQDEQGEKKKEIQPCGKWNSN
jgi:hypothetical protein